MIGNRSAIIARNIRSTSRSISVTRSIVPFLLTRTPVRTAPSGSRPRGRPPPRRWRATTGRGASSAAREPLHHAHFHPALRHPPERDIVHEVAHEEDPAPAGLEHVFGSEGIADGVGLESAAFDRSRRRRARRRCRPVRARTRSSRASRRRGLPCLMALMTPSRTATPTQWTASSSRPAIAEPVAHKLDEVQQSKELAI